MNAISAIIYPPATRVAALTTLEQFLSQVPAYAARRSYVTPDNTTVSRLSPYIRHRLISEQEVVGRVLERYQFAVAEKFVQEVVWRTYWKGWLERHPNVWFNCLAKEARYLEQDFLSDDRKRYLQVIRAETELDFFNEWTRQLITTGYLHNHVRMWFASIWIFTFKLPWQLGAMFMYRHLLDGDPASNTLSWRWVAGLQTKGKSYLARADNIATYSEGRWRPAPGDLAETAIKIQDDAAAEGPGLQGLEYTGLPQEPYGVVTTSDDLSVEQEAALFQGARSVGVLGGLGVDRHANGRESELVATFQYHSEQDALERLGALGRYLESEDEIIGWAREIGVQQVVFVVPGVGFKRAVASSAWRCLVAQGISCVWYQRDWDAGLQRLADRGFFPFWERIKKRIDSHDPLFYGKIRR